MAGTEIAATGAERLLDDFAAVIGQTMGWPPTAGRTAGVLMLSEQPMTARQLQDEVGASAGSMSEITRLLIDNGVVARGKEPGARYFVYRWRPDAWVGCLEHQLRQVEALRDLAHGTARGDLPEPARTRMRDMVDYYDFMVVRLAGLVEEYRARR